MSDAPPPALTPAVLDAYFSGVRGEDDAALAARIAAVPLASGLLEALAGGGDARRPLELPATLAGTISRLADGGWRLRTRQGRLPLRAERDGVTLFEAEATLTAAGEVVLDTATAEALAGSSGALRIIFG